MHICITGAAGSIGSRTVKHVLSQGHSITAIDIVPLPQGLELPAGSTYCQVDCTDFKAFEEALLQTPCDGVIHLGAIPNPIVSVKLAVGSDEAHEMTWYSRAMTRGKQTIAPTAIVIHPFTTTGPCTT
jgi:nucleoside-diphosphate-sugar epimerase